MISRPSTLARAQAPALTGALRASPATAKAKAEFILATDGEDFEAEDLQSGETVACRYQDFPDHFGFFLALAGISTVKQVRESSFDIRATSRLNRLYVELLKGNPDWGTSNRRADMNHFMARLIFCFFAEDTGIFKRPSLFSATVEQMSERDGSNTDHGERNDPCCDFQQQHGGCTSKKPEGQHLGRMETFVVSECAREQKADAWDAYECSDVAVRAPRLFEHLRDLGHCTTLHLNGCFVESDDLLPSHRQIEYLSALSRSHPTDVFRDGSSQQYDLQPLGLIGAQPPSVALVG